ncbi:hypothetical protein GCM10009864_19140 [Streptomyces lunalinharesii]|uniref:Uncharacterized protein n=1 Tax=Streptomyces lunalinharesii TaxID=333384 RepID=A0ABN3RJP1_9ACTN
MGAETALLTGPAALVFAGAVGTVPLAPEVEQVTVTEPAENVAEPVSVAPKACPAGDTVVDAAAVRAPGEAAAGPVTARVSPRAAARPADAVSTVRGRCCAITVSFVRVCARGPGPSEGEGRGGAVVVCGGAGVRDPQGVGTRREGARTARRSAREGGDGSAPRGRGRAGAVSRAGAADVLRAGRPGDRRAAVRTAS